MQPVILKRSVTIDGRKTSISLEAEFWNGLREIAGLQKLPVAALLHKIDADRKSANLSSAVRIYVFEYFRSRADQTPQPPRQGGRVMSTFLFDDMAAFG
jgi:predicted DNA-binding ribbon-helix-helix protein